MENKLTNDIQKKARELANSITVAHDLDPEIQEELYGHIEDKLLAYRSGEEAITDEDALILVKEHFGDARTIRGLMQDVHAVSVQVSLVRRLLALVIATSAFYIVLGVTSAIVRGIAALAFASDDSPSRLLNQWFVYHLDFPFVLAGLCFVLYRWKRSLRMGVSPWFCQWSILRMVTMAVLFGGLRWAMPYVVFSTPTMHVLTPYEFILLRFLLYVPLVCLCMVWLWWSDAITRRFRQIIAISAVWTILSVLLQSYPVKPIVVWGGGGLPDDGFLLFAEKSLGV